MRRDGISELLRRNLLTVICNPDQLKQYLQSSGGRCNRLHVRHKWHSYCMGGKEDRKTSPQNPLPNGAKGAAVLPRTGTGADPCRPGWAQTPLLLQLI